MVAALGVIVPLEIVVEAAVKVILVNVSPLPNVPLERVTWPVPVVILPPYVIVWSFALIVIGLAVILAALVFLTFAVLKL